ncbi:MAG: glycoside hydrolase family 15 protein [Nitrososphaeria archaeon]
MVRYTPLGNGRVLVAFDANHWIVDFYYSRAARDNHAVGQPFMFGISVDGTFRWLDRSALRETDYEGDTMISRAVYAPPGLGVEVVTEDFVDVLEDVYARLVTVRNLSDSGRRFSAFMHQNFYIYGNDIGDTGIYHPALRGVLHYKGARYFLASAVGEDGGTIDQYAVGVKGHRGLAGTWKDAEDGELSMNPVANGSVDSVIRYSSALAPRGSRSFFYFIACGQDMGSVASLGGSLDWGRLASMLRRTSNYWSYWSSRRSLRLGGDYPYLFRRSLFILATHVNSVGGIAASLDSDQLKVNRDGYYYVWPRDAAIAAYALSMAGHSQMAARFFDLMASSISEEGYFHHKYYVDGKLASTWLPMVRDGRAIANIQEDETALVVWSLGEYVRRRGDVALLAPYYERLIVRAADFMAGFVGDDGLPRESYDLWEERYGVHAFTVASVYAALNAAAWMAGFFGEEDRASRYTAAASRMREAFLSKFYSRELGRFARSIIGGRPDFTLDSALLAVPLLGLAEPGDPRVESTVGQLRSGLWVRGVGGLARYQGDGYMRVRDDPSIPGNPWIITTLWLARYYIRVGDLPRAMEALGWVASHAQASGVLPEQVNPYDGSPLSASPLAWSHAELILALLEMDERISGVPQGISQAARGAGA